MTTTQKLAIGIGVIGGALALYFILTSGKPKYKVGDILWLQNNEAGYWEIVNIRKGPRQWEYYIRLTTAPSVEGWTTESDLRHGTNIWLA